MANRVDLTIEVDLDDTRCPNAEVIAECVSPQMVIHKQGTKDVLPCIEAYEVVEHFGKDLYDHIDVDEFCKYHGIVQEQPDA